MCKITLHKNHKYATLIYVHTPLGTSFQVPIHTKLIPQMDWDLVSKCLRYFQRSLLWQPPLSVNSSGSSDAFSGIEKEHVCLD